MPLSPNQQEYAIAALNHLYAVLPEIKEGESVPTPENLKPFVEKYKLAFGGAIHDEDDDPYFTLQNCISNPTGFLHRIETISEEKITIGDVQSYILDLTEQKLAEYKINLTSLGWNKETILAQIKTKEGARFQQEFKSQSTQFTWEEPHVAPTIDRLYRYNIIDDDIDDGEDEFFSYHLNINIDLPPDRKIERTEFLEELVAFTTAADRDEAKVDESQIEEFEDTAQYFAVSTILMDLIEEKIITAQQARTVDLNTRELLTQPYYYLALKNKVFTLEVISNLTEDEFNNLNSLAIRTLLENKKITIGIAKLLNEYQVKLIENPFYNSKFLSDEININEIFDIAGEERHLLSPNVTQLIALKKLTFKEAKQITRASRLIIDNEPYFELLKNERLTFSQIVNLTEEMGNNLNTSIVSYLICNGKLSIEQGISLKLSESRRAVFDNAIYFKLIQKNIDVFSFFVNISEEHCQHLLSADLISLIEKEIITPEEALQLNLSEQAKLVFRHPYFGRILNKENFQLLISLTPAQCDLIRKPIIVMLLKYKVFNSPAEVLNTSFSNEFLNLLATSDFYSNLLKRNKFLLPLLKDINETQKKLLLNLTIKYLIGAKKMTLEDALNLNLNDSTLGILNHSTYAKLIKHGKLDYSFIISLQENQKKILLSSKLIHAIKYELINLNSVLAAIQNPLIVKLLEIELLEITDLHKILPSEKPFSMEYQLPHSVDKQLFQFIINDYLQLAEEGLLFEKDIFFVINNLNQFSFVNPPPLSNVLLFHPSIQETCKQTIFRRLNLIEMGAPLILPDGREDNLADIFKVVERFNITDASIYSSIFTIRLMGLFNDTPHEIHFFHADNLSMIKHDIKKLLKVNTETKSMNDESDFPLQFQFIMMKQVVEKIQNEINKEIKQNETDLTELQYKISKIYNDNLVSISDDPMQWAKAFANIIAVANESLLNFWTEVLGERSDEPKRKKLKLPSGPSLFKPKSVLKQFCKKISSIADILEIFELPMPTLQKPTPMLPSPSASVVITSKKRGRGE